MRAVQATRTGGPEVLELRDVPDPSPGPDEVLVAVEAAGVNFVDTYRRSGIYPAPFPHVVGGEGAGTVLEVGAGAAGVAVGDRVGWVGGSSGTYAERATVRAHAVVPLPTGATASDAAAVLLQGMTAHYLVHDTFPVLPGQTVLLHAGAGGVGLLLTQMAARLGATVITTVSTEAKAELSRAAGAAHVLRYDLMTDLDHDLPRAVRELAPGGVDTVFDGVGRTTFDASLACLRPRGGLALFGAASGPVPPVDPQRLNAAGSVFLTRPKLDDHVRTRAELLTRAGAVLGAVRDGELAVRVGGTYPLGRAADAHRDLESRRTTGKLLVVP